MGYIKSFLSQVEQQRQKRKVNKSTPRTILIQGRAVMEKHKGNKKEAEGEFNTIKFEEEQEGK